MARHKHASASWICYRANNLQTDNQDCSQAIAVVTVYLLKVQILEIIAKLEAR